MNEIKLKEDIKRSVTGLTNGAKVEFIFKLISELNADNKYTQDEITQLLDVIRFEVL